MSKGFAPGIADKENFGDIKKLKPGQLLDYVVQQHDAKRRGRHYDLRIGDKQKGMFSWALPQPLPDQEKGKFFAPRTHLHDFDYNTFEGEIPFGYGAGTVKTHDKGKVLITDTNDEKVSFSIADKKHPNRYTLINPGGMGHSKVWLVIKDSTPDETGANKLHYKSIAVDGLENKLKTLAPNWNVQAKVDGALQFLKINPRGKAEMLSHRISKTTGKPVIQTERFFGKIPHWTDLPSEIKNSVLYAEVHGYKDGKILPLQELGGLLNSSPENSIKKQKTDGIDLKALLFDIKRKGGKEFDSNTPYADRRKALAEVMKFLPKDKFLLPRMYDDLDGAKDLIKRIQEGKEPSTVEGVVIHPDVGTPYKVKIRPESDVHITGTFPAEKGSKYEGNAVGGFIYSHSPAGASVGRLGTGLTDETRRRAFSNPEDFVGRSARITSHGKFEKSTMHRVPSLLAIHEG